MKFLKSILFSNIQSPGTNRALTLGRDPSLLADHGILSCGRDATLALGRDTGLLISST